MEATTAQAVHNCSCITHLSSSKTNQILRVSTSKHNSINSSTSLNFLFNSNQNRRYKIHNILIHLLLLLLIKLVFEID